MRTAKLFRSFGEDYHERKLEEAYIFPPSKRRAGPRQDMPTCSRRSMTAAGR